MKDSLDLYRAETNEEHNSLWALCTVHRSSVCVCFVCSRVCHCQFLKMSIDINVPLTCMW